MAQQPNPARERVRGIVPKMIELSERSQDPDYTHVILVALPETTPVSEVAALQEDLRRAHIEAWAWVVNRSLLVAGPLLRQRLEGELRQIERIRDALAQPVFILPSPRTPARTVR